jgi:multiple sugar transport system permease protein
MGQKREMSSALKSKALGYALLIPASVMILLISVYPLLNGIYLSMKNRHLLRPNQNDFVFFSNYAKLMQDKEFFSVLAFSFAYTFFVVLFSYIAGFCLALLLNRNMRFRGVYRALILIPWVIPPVVAMTNWLWILNAQIGIVNVTLKNLGLIENPVLFFGSSSVTRVTVIFVSAWKAIPFMMITLLAGLQGIPGEMYEALRIDGAGFLQSLWYLTLPLLKSVSFISTTLMFIWTFNNFENIWLLTRGGPNDATFVLSILSYFTAFYRSNISYAATIATTMMAVMLLLSILYLRLLRTGGNGLSTGRIKG